MQCSFCVKRVFNLIISGQINDSKFVTADVPLENLAEALELMGQQKGIKYNILT